MPRYKRILLKLSGEALAGGTRSPFDTGTIERIAGEIGEVHGRGVEIGIVVGGGNIFRGTHSPGGVDRVEADDIGMLATVINSLVLKQYLRARRIDARVMTALPMNKTAEYYVCARARHHLEKKRIVIIAGGTGNPFFTTDTAAALRCVELHADLFLKATKVDGVYDKDPAVHSGAVLLPSLTHDEALRRNLRVMDATAFSLCMEYSVPIRVFNLCTAGNLEKCVEGNTVGTLVGKGAEAYERRRSD